jgi:hypothetical protein
MAEKLQGKPVVRGIRSNDEGFKGASQSLYVLYVETTRTHAA